MFIMKHFILNKEFPKDTGLFTLTGMKKNLRRIKKQSFYWYQKLIQTNGKFLLE